MAEENKTRQFKIPKDFIGNFFGALNDTDLAYELVEVNEDDELVVEVEYDSSERDDVMNLIELLDEYYEEVEDKE
ncbi:MAG: hypothetical protein Q8L81_03710 [Bacteroidota bacterium]|nr:hypothetical protein [Bacteroidota bacterium]